MSKISEILNVKFLIICMAFLIDPLIVESYNPIVSALQTAFNVNIEFISLSLSFHMMPLAIMCLFSGTLSDLYNRPKILLFGLLISTTGSFLAAASPNITVFIVSRAIQGTGDGFIMPTALALIGDVVPSKNIGKAMGLSGVISSVIGMTAGPLLSGFLATVDWRLVPLLYATFSLTIAVSSRSVLKELVSAQTKETASSTFKYLWKALKNTNIVLLSATGFIASFCFTGIAPILANALSLPPLSLLPREIGIVWSIMGLVRMGFSFIGGISVDRIGPKKTMIAGFAVSIGAMLALAYANTPLPYLLSLMAIAGFNNVSATSRSALVVELMPEVRGTISSIAQFTGFLGFAAAPILLTPIYVTTSLQSILFIAMVLIAVAVLCTTLIQSTHKNRN